MREYLVIAAVLQGLNPGVYFPVVQSGAFSLVFVCNSEMFQVVKALILDDCQKIAKDIHAVINVPPVYPVLHQGCLRDVFSGSPVVEVPRSILYKSEIEFIVKSVKVNLTIYLSWSYF